MKYKDGDKCPRCDGTLEEGIAAGMVVCLNCRFEAPVGEESMKLFRADIRENNPTKSPYTSDFLTNIYVIAINVSEAREKVLKRLKEIMQNNAKYKEEDDERERLAILKATGTTFGPFCYDLVSRSNYEIVDIMEIKDGIGEVHYTGTG